MSGVANKILGEPMTTTSKSPARLMLLTACVIAALGLLPLTSSGRLGVASAMTGPNGVAGASGAPGLQGAQGQPGASGANGSTGLSGIDGATGNQGTTGADGAPGATGPKGDSGATGPIGPGRGAPGAQGLPGASGPAGHSIRMTRLLVGGICQFGGAQLQEIDAHGASVGPPIDLCGAAFVNSG